MSCRVHWKRKMHHWNSWGHFGFLCWDLSLKAILLSLCLYLKLFNTLFLRSISFTSFSFQLAQGFRSYEHLFVPKISQDLDCILPPYPLLFPEAIVSDFMLSEGLHVFLCEVVREIKAQEQGHISRDGHEKLVKCILRATHKTSLKKFTSREQNDNSRVEQIPKWNWYWWNQCLMHRSLLVKFTLSWFIPLQ